MGGYMQSADLLFKGNGPNHYPRQDCAIADLSMEYVKLVFWYVLPYLILIENHPKIDFLLTISFISFAVVLSGVIPTPAGIGSFEFVYLLLFRPVVGTVDAVSSLLLYRFSSFILPFLYGFVYVIAERRRVIKEEIIEVKENKENQG